MRSSGVIHSLVRYKIMSTGTGENDPSSNQQENTLKAIERDTSCFFTYHSDTKLKQILTANCLLEKVSPLCLLRCEMVFLGM